MNVDNINKVKLALNQKSTPRRLKDPGKANTCLQTDYDVDFDDKDYWDNLTYHEDTLSVFKGDVIVNNKPVPVWITTDSGSMTQLAQSSYCNKLRLVRKKLPRNKCFWISSPGGGREEVKEYVVMKVNVKVKPRSQRDETYDDNPADEAQREITLYFGICESLPVPLLWGGKQMRKYHVLDYHSLKILSIRFDDKREHICRSSSWLIANTEMMNLKDKYLKNLYKDFMPTRKALLSMTLGERVTGNIATVLFPGKHNVVVELARDSCGIQNSKGK